MTNLHDGQITDLLNNSMKYNPETVAIGYAILQEKQRIIAYVERTRLMAFVDTLDERILDYLAVELRTPSYRDTYPIDVKRELIAGTLPFYSKLGTPSAVEWIVQAIFGAGCVEEWFDYGGEPHHFRVVIYITGSVIHLDEIEELRRMVYATKRLTSWLDEVHFIINAKRPATLHVGGSTGARVSMGVPYGTDDYDFSAALHAGGNGGLHSAVGVPAGADKRGFSASLHTGGAGGVLVDTGVPEDLSPPPATTILRTGGVCTLLSNLSRGE